MSGVECIPCSLNHRAECPSNNNNPRSQPHVNIPGRARPFNTSERSVCLCLVCLAHCQHALYPSTSTSTPNIRINLTTAVRSATKCCRHTQISTDSSAYEQTYSFTVGDFCIRILASQYCAPDIHLAPVHIHIPVVELCSPPN